MSQPSFFFWESLLSRICQGGRQNPDEWLNEADGGGWEPGIPHWRVPWKNGNVSAEKEG